MPLSSWLRALREKVGHALVVAPSVTVLAFDDADRVLLVRHAEGVWVAPGGAIEPGETPADAAVREAFEEVGLELELARLAGVYGGPEFVVRYANGDETAYVMTVFEARVAATAAPRPDGAETLEARFVSHAELAALPRARWLDVVLADVWRDRTRAHFAAPRWRPA
jgi:ADP-ribose pyrophosphatase YjhB (NUDIX family)